MKKGQMEILGFMVIVLLLFFGLLLYVRFSDKSGSDFITEAENVLEVSNLLSSIRMYTVCDDTQLGDVIKMCIDGGFVCGETACDIIKREVPQIVSLYGWDNGTYMFHIGDELYSPNTCKGNTFVDDYNTVGTKVRLTYCY
jgi:hypothetical protein